MKKTISITINNIEYKKEFEEIMFNFYTVAGFIGKFPIPKNHKELLKGLNENSKYNLESARDYFNELVKPMKNIINSY